MKNIAPATTAKIHVKNLRVESLFFSCKLMESIESLRFLICNFKSLSSFRLSYLYISSLSISIFILNHSWFHPNNSNKHLLSYYKYKTIIQQQTPGET